MSDQPVIPPEVASFCEQADERLRGGRPDEALRCLNFALDSLRGIDAPREQARVLEGFQRVHRATGQVIDAEKALRAALACYLKIGDRGEEARLLGELASLRISQGQLEDGGYWLQSSLHVLEELGNRAGEAEIHRSLAALHLRKGELEQAREHAAAALATMIDLGDELGEARTLGVMAQIDMRHGNFDAAMQATDRSLHLFRMHGHRPGASSAMMISAAILRRQGKLAEAEKLLLEVRAEKQEMHDVAGEAGVLNTLGIAVMDGEGARLGEAERHFLRSIELYNSLKDSQNAALTQTNLAQLYQKLGRYADVEVVLNDAIRQHRRTGASESEMRAVRALGAALSAQRKFDEAERAFTRALEFAREFGDSSLLCECVGGWADLKILRGEVAAAEAELARVPRESVPAVSRVAYLLPSLIRAALARKDVAKARLLIREAEQASPGMTPGARAALDAAITATEAATSNEAWPLKNGFLPEEMK
jgi:tetratricopeptide (TPR) repeat protein